MNDVSKCNVIIWHFGTILYASLIGHPLSPNTTPAGSIQIFTFVAFNQFCLHGRRLSIPWSLPNIPFLSVVFSIGQSELAAGTQRTIHKLTIYFSRSEWSQYRLSLSRCQSLNYPILQRFWQPYNACKQKLRKYKTVFNLLSLFTLPPQRTVYCECFHWQSQKPSDDHRVLYK